MSHKHSRRTNQSNFPNQLELASPGCCPRALCHRSALMLRVVLALLATCACGAASALRRALTRRAHPGRDDAKADPSSFRSASWLSSWLFSDEPTAVLAVKDADVFDAVVRFGGRNGFVKF